MRNQSFGSVVFTFLLWWPSAVLGQSSPVPFVPSEPKPFKVRYEGTLICYRHEIAPKSENPVRCQQEGHVPLLRRTEGHLHLLIGSTNSITAKLTSEELHNKWVRITGIYYPQTNQILVEEVHSSGH